VLWKCRWTPRISLMNSNIQNCWKRDCTQHQWPVWFEANSLPHTTQFFIRRFIQKVIRKSL
jgi:hypothetical protein